MATSRLTFLYPHLFRTAARVRPTAPTAPSKKAFVAAHRQPHGRASFAPTAAAVAKFSSSCRTNVEEGYTRRHGKAVQPKSTPLIVGPQPARGAAQDGEDAVARGGEKGSVKVQVKTSEDGKEMGKPETKGQEPSTSAPLSEKTEAAARSSGDQTDAPIKPAEDSSDTNAEKTKDSKRREPTAKAKTQEVSAPLDAVLHMEAPASLEDEESNAEKLPHLVAPPYVHHFDSYTLVKQLEEGGGFTGDQAVTTMKVVRGLLAVNLEVAKEGLVSKSDVENESYLFRAACSELRTEIQNSRKANEEKMRRERTLLQHEADILNQRLTQELGTLRDDLKGMFNDRKMAVRMEQRSMESLIQELNYKITVLLNSDSKSEIEGLRWVLTRRSVLALVFMALMVLASLRYASYMAHEHDEQRKKRERVSKSEEFGDAVMKERERRGESKENGGLEATGAAEILAAS